MVPTDSPGLNYDDLALCVYSDGNTSYGTWYDSKITNSYGMEHSPYVNKDQLNVNSVLESGFLDGYACWSSCGQSSPDVNNNYHILSCYIESDDTSSNDFFYGDNVTYSYGRSPNLPGWGSPSLYNGGAYGVNPDGNVIGNVDVDYDSCGLSVPNCQQQCVSCVVGW